MSPRDLKARLKIQAERFRLESEDVKAKFRELYKIATDAIDLAEWHKAEADELKAPKLPFDAPPPTSPPIRPVYRAPNFNPPVKVESKADRVRSALDEGVDSAKYKRFLKWSRLTHEEAMKIIAEDAASV